MTKIISNEFLTVAINSLGAEITSIKTKSNQEILWQKQDEIWDSQAPFLFPWTGRILNKTFLHEGKKFFAPNHGFLKEENHSLIESFEKNKAQFSFSHINLDKFPFPFFIHHTFTLNEKNLRHSIAITNTGSSDMPFGLGFHPGFICPFDSKKKASDYTLSFDTPQEPQIVLMEGGHPNKKTESYNSTITLRDSFFVNDSLCLTNLKAKTISLQEKGTENKIVINIENFPYVLLWSAPTPTLQFICIEPWLTLPDFINAPAEWTQKENLLSLQPNTTREVFLNMNFSFK